MLRDRPHGSGVPQGQSLPGQTGSTDTAPGLHPVLLQTPAPCSWKIKIPPHIFLSNSFSPHTVSMSTLTKLLSQHQHPPGLALPVAVPHSVPIWMPQSPVPVPPPCAWSPRAPFELLPPSPLPRCASAGPPERHHPADAQREGSAGWLQMCWWE